MNTPDITEDKPNVSLLLEWENVKLAGNSRGLRMLEQLQSQIAEVSAARNILFEIIVAYSLCDFTEEQIEKIFAIGLSEPRRGFQLRLLPVKDSAFYYEKKNIAAQAAQGDILIMVDSDVVPEPGWLNALYEAFDNPEIQVVAGQTYVEQTALYSKAMALFWIFPLRSDETEVKPALNVFGNNVAYRRDTFLRYQYPILDQVRGSAVQLRNLMGADGIITYAQPNARTRHPPPKGLVHFFKRAVCQGYDSISWYEHQHGKAPWRILYWTLRNNIAHDFCLVIKNHKKVGLSALGLIYALNINLAYNVFIIVGEIMAKLVPEFTKRHFTI